LSDEVITMEKGRPFMQKAIDVARSGIKKGNSPFGACIIKDGKVVAAAHNTVLTKKDSTNHAEMNAIRLACRKLESFDLSGCSIYTTTEPCPMCFSAIHWARIGRMVHGTYIKDVKALGFSELTLSDRRMKREGGSPVRIECGFMRNECMELLRDWEKGKGKTY
jgi:guanine deaminase